ncbi:MAG: isoprenylcysteine carboxylmethyltransferase family protein [Desulfamplus sp.]|nr:isoprenylcysteine carboxylmethyltransferase family protein [Desulfamplus sp.]
MQKLELKIPPVLLTFLFSFLIWIISMVTNDMNMNKWVLYLLSLFFFIGGSLFSIAGVIGFRNAKTTVNPLKPDNASSLVDTGIYRISRNPMYVGLFLLLISLALFLSNLYAFIAALFFILYMNKFQIAPEERALEKIFGTNYIDYKNRVRRWI